MVILIVEKWWVRSSNQFQWKQWWPRKSQVDSEQLGSSKKIVSLTDQSHWLCFFLVVKLVQISLPTQIPRFSTILIWMNFENIWLLSKEVSKYVPEVRADRHKTSSLDLSTRSRHEAAASPDLSSPISVHSCVHTCVRVFKCMFINKCTHVYTNSWTLMVSLSLGLK